MAIEFITGVPGSGKTYKSLFALYLNFAKDKSHIKKYKNSNLIYKDIDHAFTNINELNFDLFNDKIKNLEWDIFKNHLTIMHQLYKDKNTDTKILEYAKQHNMSNCLIILDECHNYLDKQDVVLVWWLSYHRHLHHQIYLITQNLVLINSKYKNFSEFFYKAVPSSMKLFKNSMVYKQYISSRLSLKSKTATIKLPVLDFLFASYTSGANQKSKNILLKFILIVLFFLFLSFLVFSFYTQSFKDENSTNIIEEEIKEVVQNKTVKESKFNYSSQRYKNHNFYKILCNKKECLIENNFYSFEFIKILIDNFNASLLKTNHFPNTNFSKYHLFIDELNYQKFFVTKEVSNDKDNKNISAFSNNKSKY